MPHGQTSATRSASSGGSGGHGQVQPVRRSPSPVSGYGSVVRDPGSPWLTAKPSGPERLRVRLARVASGSILPRVLTALTRWQRSASIPEPLTEPGQFGRGQGCDEAVEAIGFVINCTGFCTGRILF